MGKTDCTVSDYCSQTAIESYRTINVSGLRKTTMLSKVFFTGKCDQNYG